MREDGPADVFAAAARLHREGTPFVLATVVRAERPTSARPGAKAIVTADGSFLGFVGGTCVRPAVRRESLRALAERKPRLLRITPDDRADGEAEEGVREERMACVSGGALDIHLEPYLPSRRLLLAGDSPIVEALRTLGSALGMEVRTEWSDADASFVVVAGHGEGEWEALRAGLAGERRAAWVGLVASPRRAAAVRERLLEMGLSEADVARLRSPAGLDIGAETPGEIALSILAQIIQDRTVQDRTGQDREAPPAPEPPVAETAVDPICGMTVSRDSTHRVEGEDGTSWWFCCAGCAETFRARI